MDSKHPDHADVQYVNNGHERQRLDIYLPNSPGASNIQAYPLIIYIHGGAFKFGSKKSKFLPYRLLEKEYAIASLDYRLSGDAIFPAAVQDCKAATRFLRYHAEKYNLQTDQLVVWGESAGAHCAAMLGATSGSSNTEFDVGAHLDVSCEIAGVVDYYGPTDFLLMDDQAPSGSHMKHNDVHSPESLYLGGKITDIPDVVRRANPISYINQTTEDDQSRTKYFIAHGTKDLVVPFGQSVVFEEALKRKNIDVNLHSVQNADHCFDGATDDQMKELDEATDRFLASVFRA